MIKKLMLTVLLSFSASPLLAQAALVSVTAVHPTGTLQVAMEQNTSLESRQRVLLFPKQSGTLAELLVHKGETVKAGQVLAKLDHVEESAALASAKAALTAAQARVSQSNAKAANAKAEYDRYNRLKKSGFSTQQELESHRTASMAAHADLKAAQAAVAQAKAQVNVQNAKLEKMTVRAPFDGTVLNDYNLTPGASVGPNQAVFEVANLTRLKGSLALPEARRYEVKVGDAVEIRVDALASEVFRGQVAFIGDAVDTATRTVTLDIHLTATGDAARLRPGMFGRARLILQEVTDVFVLPASALFFDETGGQKQTFVWLAKEGKAARQVVTTGLEVDGQTEITSGLSDGDQVITFGASGLTDGQPITLLGNNQS